MELEFFDDKIFYVRFPGNTDKTPVGSDKINNILSFHNGKEFYCTCMVFPGLRIGCFNQSNANGHEIFNECSCFPIDVSEGHFPFGSSCAHLKDAKRKFELYKQMTDEDKHRIIYTQHVKENQLEGMLVWEGCKKCGNQNECDVRMMLEGSDSILIDDDDADRLENALKMFCPICEVAMLEWYSRSGKKEED